MFFIDALNNLTQQFLDWWYDGKNHPTKQAEMLLIKIGKPVNKV